MNFWENIYKKEGPLWEFEAANSAYFVANYFQKENYSKILIPGIGYGRNVKPFRDNGIEVIGIEISESAIKLAKTKFYNLKIYKGSVIDMPFDKIVYDGIYCYSLIHLLNKNERKLFLQSCYNQLKINGIKFFVVVSTKANMYGEGKYISKNRYKINIGLDVFFFDPNSIEREFNEFGLVEYKEFDEPIKHINGIPPLKCYIIKCKKNG